MYGGTHQWPLSKIFISPFLTTNAALSLPVRLYVEESRSIILHFHNAELWKLHTILKATNLVTSPQTQPVSLSQGSRVRKNV
jgi:hypothetical protein